MIVSQLMPQAVSLCGICKAVESDAEISQICENLCLNRPSLNKPYSVIQNELRIVDNILVRGSRIVIPSSLPTQVFEYAQKGHPGITKMKERLHIKVWWPGIDNAAEHFVRSCDSCQKEGKDITIKKMTRCVLLDGPWQDIAMDFKALPTGQQLAVVIDYFSRFIEVKVMTTTTTVDTISFFCETFARHCIPYSLTTDNGPQFSSKEFTEFCLQYGITHYTTIPYWAQANGEVKCQNKSLQKILQIAQLQKSGWQQALTDYLLMYQSTSHSVTGKSLAKLLFGRNLRDKLPVLKERVEEEEVRDRDALQKLCSLQLADGIPKKDITVGDEVLIQRPFTRHKWDSRFEKETGTVTAVNGPKVTVATPSKTVVRHPNQIEWYIPPELPSTSPATITTSPVALSPDMSIAEPPPIGRSGREKRTPGWWQDFIPS